MNLSDNYHKRTQTNTVVVQQEKMDRVGFEPTTSAMKSRRLSYSKVAFRLATIEFVVNLYCLLINKWFLFYIFREAENSVKTPGYLLYNTLMRNRI